MSTTGLVFRCRRCGGVLTEAHSDPEVALRRACEAGDLSTIHECEDGASGLADIIGTGPGETLAERKEARGDG